MKRVVPGAGVVLEVCWVVGDGGCDVVVPVDTLADDVLNGAV